MMRQRIFAAAQETDTAVRKAAVRKTSAVRKAIGLGLLTVSIAALAGCSSGGGGNNNNTGGGSTPVVPVINNVLPAQVNLGPTGNNGNILYTSVTVCLPGTATCQVIPNIEVDTGSTGLRILATATTLQLARLTNTAGAGIGNCIPFADNSYMWGPIALADVKMSGEVASSVPIQIVAPSNFAAAPTSCSTGGTALQTVQDLGGNGILGIGLFRQDCGPACTAQNTQIPGVYFSCATTGSCTPTTVALGSQLQNPIWFFPQDNNGVLVSLPALPNPATGALAIAGSLIFGIGTQSNNALGTAKVQTPDSSGNFTTTFNGVKYSSSFIDSGSNGLYFLDAATTGLPDCGSAAPSFYCPVSPVNFTATTTGANGIAVQVPFTIGNALTLFNTNNAAFSTLGGSNPGTFDWGLPFFFGRNVFVGIESQTTPGGVGPYWAY